MLRSATSEDSQAIAQVIAAAQAGWSEWAGDAFEPYDKTHLVEVWAARVTDTETVTAVWEHSGDLCAVVSFEPEARSFQPSNLTKQSAHLSTLFCLPSQQGSGIASTLHAWAAAEMHLLGYTTVRLWVPSGATQARRFYTKHLWTETGRTTLFAGLERTEMRRDV